MRYSLSVGNAALLALCCFSSCANSTDTPSRRDGVGGSAAENAAGGLAGTAIDASGAGGRGIAHVAGGSGVLPNNGGNGGGIIPAASGAGGAAGSAAGAGPGPRSSGSGGGAAVACTGIPITPDTGGFVSPASNTLGIHGSWFVYSDCVDQHGVNCSTVKAPPANTFPNVGGKMCTSGTTSSAAGAWGAGIALELNDGPPQQPYDTTAHGIKGICFVLSGTTIPSTSLRVAFPTKNNPDNAYFAAVTTPGTHTVLFTDTAQGSWVTNKVAFEPTKVMLLQFQIPSSTTSPVPWDFCIEALTAVLQ